MNATGDGFNQAGHDRTFEFEANPPDGRSGLVALAENGAIEDSWKLLQDVLNSLADGVVVADANGHFLLFNPAAERMLGIGPLGVPLPEWSSAYGCFREDGVTPFPSNELPLTRAIRGETVDDHPLFLRNSRVPDGVWLSINSSPLRNRAGEIVGGVVVFRDVTAKRRELAHTELLSTVVEQTADTVVITDRDGLIEYVNPAVEQMTGFRASELIGRTPRTFRSGNHPNAFYDELWATLIEGRVFRGTLTNRKKNGDEYHSEQTITPIRDAVGNVVRFVSVGKDLTDRRKAEEQDSQHLMARKVQQRLFPIAPPPACGFEFGSACYTADKTGGDYFDFISLPDAALGVVVGDVSGHAFDAAMVMAVTRAYLRSAAQTASDPGAILTHVNRVLHGDIPDSQFVTLVFASLHAPSGTLRYASAGHTTGYVLDANGRIRSELASTGIPLGIFAGTTYQTVAVPRLEVDDLVVLFTDGVTEAQDEEGALFEPWRALEVVRRHQGEPPAKIVHRVYRAARDFSGRRPQDDDITTVICRVGGRDGLAH